MASWRQRRGRDGGSGGSGDALSDIDRAYLATDPQLLMVAVLLFGEAPTGGGTDPGELQAAIASRLVRIPWTRLRVHRNGRRWEPDPDFELSRHVQLVSPARPLETAELIELATARSTEQLDMDRPLWVLDIVSRVAGASVGLIMTVHHGVGDGLAIVGSITSSLLGVAPEPLTDDRAQQVSTAPSVPALSQRPGRRRRRKLDGTLAIANSLARVGRGAELMTRLDAVGGVGPVRSHRRQCQPEQGAVWEGSLLDVKLLGRAFDVTVAEVLLAAITGGLAVARERTGRLRPFTKVLVPVHVRDANTEGEPGAAPGNELGIYLVGVPLDRSDPLRMLRAASGALRTAKAAGDDRTIADIERLVHCKAGGWLRTSWRRLRETDIAMSTLPGPPFPLWLFDLPLASSYASSSLTDVEALKVTALSQVDRLAAWIVSCPSCVGPAEEVLGGFTETIDALIELQAKRTAIEAQPGFAGLGTAALDRLATAAKELTAEAGDVLIEAGSRSDSISVIDSGECGVTIDGKAVNRLGRGDSFGEIGVVLHVDRTATVTALTPVHLFQIPGEVVAEALVSDPTALRQASYVAHHVLARTPDDEDF